VYGSAITLLASTMAIALTGIRTGDPVRFELLRSFEIASKQRGGTAINYVRMARQDCTSPLLGYYLAK